MSGQTELICPLCERSVPRVTAHHLIPKSRSGRETTGICPDCHGMIHALFPNRELARDLSSIEALKCQPEFATWLEWIGRRPADRRYRLRRSRRARNRGRAG